GRIACVGGALMATVTVLGVARIRDSGVVFRRAFSRSCIVAKVSCPWIIKKPPFRYKTCFVGCSKFSAKAKILINGLLHAAPLTKSGMGAGFAAQGIMPFAAHREGKSTLTHSYQTKNGNQSKTEKMHEG